MALAAATVLVPLGASIASAQESTAGSPGNVPAANFEGSSSYNGQPTTQGVLHRGGEYVPVSTYPGIIAGIRVGGPRPEGETCTGTVVAPKKVLIAAHCADAAGEKSFVYGLDDLADYEGGSGTGFQFSKVTSYKKHPSYVNFDQGYDVAMVTLATEIRLLDGAAYPAIASSADPRIPVGTTIDSYGYGKKDPDDQTRDVKLTRAKMPVVDGSRDCLGVGAGFKDATMICAGYSDGRVSILQGDSGGPLVHNNKIYGVASWGKATWDWYSVWGRLNNDMGDWAITERGPVDPGQTDATIAVEPSSLKVNAGQFVSTTVTSKAGSTAGENITLSASGLPVGVKAIFSPTVVKAGENAKLTFEAAGDAANGPATVTINGATAGGKTITATVNLTVEGGIAGPFGISLDPASIAVEPGESGSSGLNSVAGESGPESVTLTASGLPGGATLSFQPNEITTGESAKVLVETTSSTPKGSYDVTVTGTNAGGKTATATLKLTVGAPAPVEFGITVDPASATVNKNENTSVGLKSTGSGDITLSASGLPAGVTASFQPSTIKGGESAKITFSADATVETGDVTVTITGTNAGVTKTADVRLSVKGDAPGGAVAVALNPSSGSVQQGQLAQFAAKFTGGTGNITVSASGVPGAQFFYNPQVVANGGTSNIWIFTNFQTAAGTYPVTVTGTAADGSKGTATYTLTVTRFGYIASPNQARAH